MLLYRERGYTFRVDAEKPLSYWHVDGHWQNSTGWHFDPKWARQATLEFVLLTGEMP